MPHLRKRYAENNIKKSLTFSPVVGVLGQRQVGKTTLLEVLSSSYSTFDREADLLEAEHHADIFLSQRKPPFAIDESQLCPKIFPAIKEVVRLKKTPGQFLLSGSVRFTSRKLIRESLTGRIVNREVLPFTIRESHGLPISKFLSQITRIENENHLLNLWTDKKIQNERAFSDYLVTGGLPGIAFFRDSTIRLQKFEAQIDTLLNRDIRLVIQTSLTFPSLRALLKWIALKQGEPLQFKEAASYSQISTVTLKKILFAFESLFLIRSVTSLGPEKKTSFFLEDQGMATWLVGPSHTLRQDILRGIYANLRQEFYYGTQYTGMIHHYRTKHGVEVPLVFQYQDQLIGIVPCEEVRPPQKTLGSALAFVKSNPKAIVVIALKGDSPIYKADRIYGVPYAWLV